VLLGGALRALEEKRIARQADPGALLTYYVNYLSENIGIFMLKNSDIIKTIKRKLKLIAAVFQLYTLSSVLTLTCMNDLTVSEVLIGERILCNAVKDIYFTNKMQFKKLNN
jgi:hypothetical protein